MYGGIEIVVLLIIVAFLSGVGCTSIGVGGIFATISLLLFTDLSPGEIAGTAHVVFIAISVIGILTYLNSGELMDKDAVSLAIPLGVTGMVGSASGAYLNSMLSSSGFSILLASVVFLTGMLILYDRWGGFSVMIDVDHKTIAGLFIYTITGTVIGILSGIVGVGGPVILVPVLILFGVPILLAVALAQVQALFISTTAGSVYIFGGQLSITYSIMIGLPLVFGAIVGWYISHKVDPKYLELILSLILLVIPFYIVW